jgi:hypothetical protein
MVEMVRSLVVTSARSGLELVSIDRCMVETGRGVRGGWIRPV